MAKRKKTDKIKLGDSAPANNPFAAALAGLTAPVADLPPETAPEPTSSKGTALAVTTRVDRKARRGKTVTLVDGLDALTAAQREQIASELRKALGTGVTIEGTTLVVQGDMGPRIATWFDKRSS